jgi:dCTP deaminase
MAYVVGRSTWGRLGLIVATALGVHPGFSGALTLELRNLGETPLRIYPGQVVAQLFFHDVASPAGVGGGIGQYSGSVSGVPKRLSTEKTHAKLKALREQS